jgi:hypothetical protein
MDGGCCIVEADFSQCATDSWLGQFLYGKQADIKKICIEANLRFMGLYKAPWEQPLTICLSAIGGAVVATVATWLITYFIMRKKVKNATRLGANGEDPALADGVPTDTTTPDIPPAEGADSTSPPTA